MCPFRALNCNIVEHVHRIVWPSSLRAGSGAVHRLSPRDSDEVEPDRVHKHISSRGNNLLEFLHMCEDVHWGAITHHVFAAQPNQYLQQLLFRCNVYMGKRLAVHADCATTENQLPLVGQAQRHGNQSIVGALSGFDVRAGPSFCAAQQILVMFTRRARPTCSCC